MKVIAICGTNGSGKGTVVELLQQLINCTHISAREMIIQTAKNDGVDILNRDDLRMYNEKRNREGKTLISDFANKFNTEENENKIFVFESVRRVGEVKELRKIFGNNFILVSVDAPIEMRYERNKKRNSMSDNVDFDTFKLQEKLESENEDENQMNIPKCVEMSDVKLTNIADLEELKKQIDEKILTNPIFTGML